MLQAIYSDRCWIEGGLQSATLCIKDGVIEAIVPYKTAEAMDFSGMVIMPGVIDVHVHINEPGRTDWEGFETATAAAAAGGTTLLIDMPLNSSPVTTNSAAFAQKRAASEGKMYVHCGFYAGLVPENVAQLEALMEEGVVGVKCFLVHSGIDEFPNVTAADLEKAMPVIARKQLKLLAHCELADEYYDHDFYDHVQAYAHYLGSRPKAWENNAVNLMIDLCRKHHCPVHIVHVSSAEALEAIAVAKAAGLPVTAETCAHYLFFHAEAIPDGNPLYKCAPPIREKANNDLLKKALKDGVLDFITTDHSPAPPDIKELQSGNLQKAWGGIASVQFLLSAAWTALKDTLSLAEFIPLLTAHPAKFLQIQPSKGVIAVGSDADLVVWNPAAWHTITQEEVLFRHKISPYIGQKMYGTVHTTVVQGEMVFHNKKIADKKIGKWLLKK